MLTLSTAKMLSFAEEGEKKKRKTQSLSQYTGKCSKVLGKQCYIKSSSKLA